MKIFWPTFPLRVSDPDDQRGGARELVGQRRAGPFDDEGLGRWEIKDMATVEKRWLPTAKMNFKEGSAVLPHEHLRRFPGERATASTKVEDYSRQREAASRQLKV